MAVTITRKAVERRGWPLTSPADMFTALEELEDHGWTGAVSRESDWALRLSCSGKQTVNAAIGQWLVLDVDLKAIAASDFDAEFDSDEPVEFPEQVVEEAPVAEPEPYMTSEDTAVPLARAVR